ncbi:MAG: tetratricopeptide repeat protein [Betaproteobacteria bacterium]
MRGLMTALALMLACACTDAATPSGHMARELALAQLQNPDADTRLAGCQALAEVGIQQDLPLVHSHLFDGDARVRDAAEAVIWSIWSRSGDAEVDGLFAIGVEQMRDGQLKRAVDTFSRIIAARPDFTEAWNKRATLYFLLGDDDLSLADCGEVLRRNPHHFGVLAGYGQIYLRKGELQRALDYFEQALAINPNMTGVQASIDALRALIDKRGRRFI